MNVASRELCQKLHDLSTWEDTYFVYYFDKHYDVFDADQWLLAPRQKVHQDSIPAYDLSCLLRKLPIMTDGGKWKLSIFKNWHNGRGCEWYTFGYVHINSMVMPAITDTKPDHALHMCEADTPEDCAAMLCIELFEKDILTKEII